MADRNDPDDKGGRPEPKRRPSRPRREPKPARDRDEGPGRDRDLYNKQGDDPSTHAQILERRWLGSEPPTAELYARAREQWRALPGAVMSPASDVPIPGPPPPEAPDDPDSSEGRS